MKILAFLLCCLSSINNKIVYCENPELASGDGSRTLTLLTLANGLAESEALARFERRAVYDGFREGTTLKIIQPRKVLLTKSDKLELIRTAIKKLVSDSKENAENHVILYIENELSLVLSNPKEVLDAFQTTGARILLPADSSEDCWLGSHEDWPKTYVEEKSVVLNPVAFIGYSKDLAALFATKASSLHEVFKSTFLEGTVWSKLKIELDTKPALFYTLKSDSVKNDLELTLNKNGKFLIPELVSKNSSERVHIIQTNLCKAGDSIVYLNSLGSYLTPTLQEDKIELDENEDKLPTVTLAIFVERPTPFLEEFFQLISELDYNKKKIYLFVHNHFRYNAQHVDKFLNETADHYASVKYIRSGERVKEWGARKLAVNWALEKKTDYLFSVDGVAHFDDETTLRVLIESNKQIIAPMLCLQTEFLPNICNWWGSVGPEGLYKKTSDYDDIAEDNHKGIWNVPFINAAYLIKASVLRDAESKPEFVYGLSDPDIAFSYHNRARGVFMHVTNEFHPGHLVSNENFELQHFHNELYQLFDNKFDWENRYIHPNHSKSLKEDFKPLEPCQDVFWYPIVTPRFAKEMIEEMENYGKWADGSVEARGDLYPTVDIQMNEIHFNTHFHEFLRLYVHPLQEKSFKDYEVYPPRTDQAFVVRYSADDQRELKPHFDESTYTLNIALNEPGKDFEGGGCRFTRFNCSVVDTRLGWGFVHPGQFTHKHEGLKITKGIRYIMVAFIDPRTTDEDDSEY